MEWKVTDRIIADNALEDVALLLGYDGMAGYNEACRSNPDDVRARLAAL